MKTSELSVSTESMNTKEAKLTQAPSDVMRSPQGLGAPALPPQEEPGEPGLGRAGPGMGLFHPERLKSSPPAPPSSASFPFPSGVPGAHEGRADPAPVLPGLGLP